MENKPGNGSTSPFGNEKGATSNGPSDGGNDFLTKPEGSGAAGSGVRDFTKENRAQKTGTDPTICPESIPTGGKILTADPGAASSKVSAVQTATSARSPFKLKG